MANFFPKQTLEFKFEEPKAFRRISFSLVEMAIITGILVRVYRVVVLTHGSNNWLYLGGTITLGVVFLPRNARRPTWRIIRCISIRGAAPRSPWSKFWPRCR